MLVVAAAVVLVIGGVAAALAVRDAGSDQGPTAGTDRCPVTTRQGRTVSPPQGLVAFDRETGDVRWRSVVPGRLQVDDGRLSTISRNGVRRPIDLETGEVTGCERTSERVRPAPGTFLNLPAEVDDGLTLQQLPLGGIQAVRADGSEAWAIPKSQAMSLTDDGLVVLYHEGATPAVPGEGAVVDVATGRVRWTLPDFPIGPALSGVPFLLSGTGSPVVEARDLTDGGVLWHTELANQPEAWALVADGDFVVPQGEGADVALVDQSTGEVRWTADGGSPAQDERRTKGGWADAAVAVPGADLIVVAVTAQAPFD
jgi:outer membrane protein assembly factor BamB